MATTYKDLTLDVAIANVSGDAADDPIMSVLRTLGYRVADARMEMDVFRQWCRRADELYYAEHFTSGGADLWWDHPTADAPGRSHVSINLPATYVDIPAALQAYPPIENMRATKDDEQGRDAADQWQRVYFSWKQAENYDLKFHKACINKGLYGRTFGKVYWDRDQGRPCVEVIEQPQNLWVGYRNDSYDKPEWAAYVQRMTPNAVADEFGVLIDEREYNGSKIPFPTLDLDPQASIPHRPWLYDSGDCMIEVWDYWYRKPRLGKNGRVLGFDTYNIIFAGNVAVRGPLKYPEYKGEIPYIPLYNTYIPGVPNGRSELYDMEPIIRETFERVTSGSQMIASATGGDFWQIVGPDAPLKVTDAMKPVRNKVVAPGPGNRIEAITPFIAQFQLEQFLGRLDRYGAIISGLNDLLLGLAPQAVLNSSKAINALISNYETRIAMRRLLLYVWRRQCWEMAAKIWVAKDATVAKIYDNGGGWLDIQDPSLSPRDEAETAVKAANLVQAKLWSQDRGMDAVGVDDPSTEKDIIREESTDAALWPERVELMAQLLQALQALNLPQPGAAVAQAQGQLSSGQQDLRAALGAQTPTNTTSSQQMGDQGMTAPIPGAPPQAGGAPAPFAAPPAQGGLQSSTQYQTMIQHGKLSDRILTQRQQKTGK